MNYEEVKIAARKKYEEALREIELCKEIADKVMPSLPDGWNCEICETVFNLHFVKGKNSLDSTDAGEFKLVCKLVESATGEKLKRKAVAHYDQNILNYLYADKYIHTNISDLKNDVCVCVNVTLYNPENIPDCKIEWKRRWIKEAVISDECLGINQGGT